MRKRITLDKARFCKQGLPFEGVRLPHTWNALDGQDGGMDYYRGACVYEIELPNPTPGLKQFIEFEGANHEAEVFVNGARLGVHRGGFSTFRFDMTPAIKPEGNLLTVCVNNDAPNTYPQKADFTFFGGLYRPVHMIEVNTSHFDLEKLGSAGIFVTADATGRTRVDAFTVNAEGYSVRASLLDEEGREVACSQAPALPRTVLEMRVMSPEKWNGPDSPKLYTARVALEREGQVCDQIEQRYGYRSFHVDPERGFFLNGQAHPLRGVCRHQDRQDMGWAISDKEHAQDMSIIREMGANSVRLAHYQHSQAFYDLCDENGVVVWAEIPYISWHIPGDEARENTFTQMRELIAQNYHHPSICFWGIGNEITMFSGESEEVYQNLCELNALAKRMDPSRLTTMAHLSMIQSHSPHTTITDLQGYNVYLGWYVGEMTDNGPYLDALRAAQPDRPLCMSEYGADALTTWHTAAPRNHDYTEEYQAAYHEELINTFASRPWLWATYVWNMFDFASDARDEGGSKGRNNKGLVTFDRRIYKDAFYAYQAAWTTKPMVHICGRRFAERAPGQRDIKAYTNCDQVTLMVNGGVYAVMTAQNRACVFKDVPLINGDNAIIALVEGARDEICLRGVDAPNRAYELPPDSIIAGNWFDDETGEELTLDYPDGYYSIRDTIGDLQACAESAKVFEELRGRIRRPGGMKQDGDMASRLKGISLQQIIKMSRMDMTPKDLVALNRRLNAIRKP